MHLKKILTTLLLVGATLANAGSKVPPAAPPSTQQNAPADKDKQPEVAPTPPAPSTPTFSDQAAKNPAPLPSSQDMTNSYESAFVRMLVTLLGLIFLVFATFWLLRRMGKGKFKMGGGRTINVVERRAVSPKTMLYIVEIGSRKVLISESQVEVRALTTLEELPETTD